MSIDIVWLAVYFAIAVLCIPLVRILGPVSIVEYRLEELYDQHNGVMNILYRVLSPMICCSLPMLACVMAFDALGLPLPAYRWLPTVLYWLIFLSAKFITANKRRSLCVTFMEAILSSVLAIIADRFIVEGYTQVGLVIFDQSSLAFQMEIALFYVAIEIIVSIGIRREYKTSTQPSFCGNRRPTYYGGNVDVGEKKLFSYEKDYGPLLPSRYKNDPLLRCMFFSIMAIEDSNRPSGIRVLERMVFKFGAAKTTGIMQQKAERALSDEESVVLAFDYVEGMWDGFLRKFAKSRKKGGACSISFASDWYSYDYDSVGNALIGSFSALYGDYCGTRLHDASWVLRNVKAFEERNCYCLMPSKVVAQGSLFPMESRWITSDLAFWEDGQRVRGVHEESRSFPVYACLTRSGSSVASDSAEFAIAMLKDAGWCIDGVTYVESALCKIECYGGPDLIKPRIEGWTSVSYPIASDPEACKPLSNTLCMSAR